MSQIVYLLTNEAFPKFVKIGRTTADMPNRLRNLYSTGVPFPFECELAVEVENATAVEDALHRALSVSRVNPSREFFEVDAADLKPLLRLLGKEIEIGQSEEPDEEGEKAARRYRNRRPDLDFEEMGLGAGDRLSFLRDRNLVVTIVDNKNVEHEGDIVSLTHVTKKVFNGKTRRPTNHWWSEKHERPLIEIYEETYPVDSEDSDEN